MIHDPEDDISEDAISKDDTLYGIYFDTHLPMYVIISMMHDLDPEDDISEDDTSEDDTLLCVHVVGRMIIPVGKQNEPQYLMQVDRDNNGVIHQKVITGVRCV